MEIQWKLYHNLSRCLINAYGVKGHSELLSRLDRLPERENIFSESKKKTSSALFDIWIMVIQTTLLPTHVQYTHTWPPAVSVFPLSVLYLFLNSIMCKNSITLTVCFFERPFKLNYIISRIKHWVPLSPIISLTFHLLFPVSPFHFYVLATSSSNTHPAPSEYLWGCFCPSVFSAQLWGKWLLLWLL